MQDMMPPVGADAQLIQSYGADGFRIGNQGYSTSVIVTEKVTTTWDGELSLEKLLPVFHADPRPEILLIGTGARHELIDPALRSALKSKGLATDTMDTGAACRTFNILLSEGRRVAAVLLLPTPRP